MDTVEANVSLDLRRMSASTTSLRRFSGSWRHTNPAPLQQPRQGAPTGSAGVRVVELVPCQPCISRISRKYLQTKKRKMATSSRVSEQTSGQVRLHDACHSTERALSHLSPDTLQHVSGFPQHTESTARPPKSARRPVGKFTAFAGQLEGKNLLIMRGKRLVQLWRRIIGKKDDWSVLILTFSRVAGGAQVDLVHVASPLTIRRVCAKDGRSITGGRWKKYLAER